MNWLLKVSSNIYLRTHILQSQSKVETDSSLPHIFSQLLEACLERDSKMLFQDPWIEAGWPAWIPEINISDFWYWPAATWVSRTLPCKLCNQVHQWWVWKAEITIKWFVFDGETMDVQNVHAFLLMTYDMNHFVNLNYQKAVFLYCLLELCIQNNSSNFCKGLCKLFPV